MFYTTANSTDKAGKYRGSFILSDLITRFRFSVDAFDNEGSLGYTTALITSQKYFYLDFSPPVSMVVGDSLSIPVNLFNTLEEQTLNARVSVLDYSSQYLEATLESENQVQQVPAQSSANQTLNITATNSSTDSDKAFVQIRGQASPPDSPGQRYLDSLIKEIAIVSQGILQVE